MMSLLRKSWKAVFFLVCILTAAGFGFASEDQEAVGTIVALRGEVTALGGSGEIRVLEIKSPLYRSDLLRTGSRARVQILFKDNAIVSLGGNTALKIAEYEWDPEKDQAVMTMEIKEGVFRVMGGLISKKDPEKVTTKTPPATIGIRGSMYAGLVTPDGLTVVFEGGRGINLINATGTIAITSSGYGSSVRDWQGSLGKPARFESSQILRLQQGFGAVPTSRSRPAGVVGTELPISLGKADLNRSGGRGGGEPASGRALDSGGQPTPGIEESPTDQEKSAEQKLLDSLAAAARENPESAPQVLRQAVQQKRMTVDAALEGILAGMQQIDKPNFDRLISEAMELGLTVENARKIAARLKARGGGCP